MATTRKKKVQSDFALVRYVPREKTSENPFGEFVRKLSAHFQEQRTSVGAVRWTTFPLEYALASGLWEILVAIGNELGKPLSTPRQVAVVATKVNQLLCASIVAVFPTVEEMVAKFEVNVVQLLDRAIALGYRPGMNISLVIWRKLRSGDEEAFVAELRCLANVPEGDAHLLFQGSVALFFTEIIKAGRLNYRLWKSEYERLMRLNTFSEEMGFAWAEVEDDLRLIELGLEPFNLALTVAERTFKSNDSDSEYLVNVYHIREIEERLQSVKREVELARKLPVDILVLKNRMALDLYFSVSMEPSWVHSQLLITAGNLPERDWLLTTEFPVALEALKQLESEELVDQTLRRWREKRTFAPTSEDEAAFREMLLCRARIMKRWTVAKRGDPVPDIDATIYQMSASRVYR